MNILLVGSGGREHALAWKIARSPRCRKLYAAPGNAGIAAIAECVPLKEGEIDKLAAFAREKAIDLVVIGPETPLVGGLADRLHEMGIKVFGPSAAAARLEGSKAFMKGLCLKYGIPTAAYGVFTDLAEARPFIRAQGAPIVVKADGLAAGKGVIIARSVEEATEAAADMLSGDSFGASGRRIVIEEFMEGEELSFFALTDGKTAVPFASAQDHKRAFDGDMGPNTGGMGAYTPAHMMTPALESEIMETIVGPTVAAMEAEGTPFAGILYAGIMLVNGKPKLLEYNIRFGDPECQALMMRLKGDIVDILDAVACGRLQEARSHVAWHDGAALCVVLAANGYPGTYVRNTVIDGLDRAAGAHPDVEIFHAGTARGAEGRLVNTGGRVLGVTARGPTIGEARANAYAAAAKIEWPEGFYRRDIGARATG